MPLDFTCPHCHARTIVEDEFLGQSGPCFSCGKTVVIPLARGAESTRRPKAGNAGRMWFGIAAVIAAGLLFVAVGVAVMLAFVVPAFQTARATAQQNVCTANLGRIYVALKRYHDQHGSFPPAYVADPSGKPMYSWRVLILPHLGEQLIYQQFQLNEPWDSPNNLRLAQRMPAVYRCGADPSPGNLGETSYLAVVGKKTVFPEAESRSIAHVRDGLHATLMVVECHDSGVGWAEPKDLPAGALRFGVNGKRSGKQLSLRSDHPTGAHVLMADGQPLLLPDDISPDVLDALSTIRGGEEIPWDLMPASR